MKKDFALLSGTSKIRYCVLDFQTTNVTLMRFKLFLALLSLIPLGACADFQETFGDLNLTPILNPQQSGRTASGSSFNNSSPCPYVAIVNELSSISEFTDERNPSEKNLISRVNLSKVESSCDFERGHVALDLKLAFEGILGARGKKRDDDKPFFTYPFFVAVTDSSQEILAKEVFAATITYDREEKAHTYFENMRQLIPIEYRSEARGYNVLIGFQLSPNQLKYNRENMVPVSSDARNGKGYKSKTALIPRKKPKQFSADKVQG